MGEQEGIVVVEVMLLDIHCGKVEFGEQLKVESESRKGEGFGLKLFEEVVSDRSVRNCFGDTLWPNNGDRLHDRQVRRQALTQLTQDRWRDLMCEWAEVQDIGLNHFDHLA